VLLKEMVKILVFEVAYFLVHIFKSTKLNKAATCFGKLSIADKSSERTSE